MNKCVNCQEFKSYDSFSKSTTRKNGLCAYCRVCDAIRCKKYREQNVEKEKIRAQIYRESHKEEAAQYHQEVLKPKLQAIRSELLFMQGGRCAICKTILSVDTARTDHDHNCCPSASIKDPCEKCRRGVLCHSCNLGLGQFQDDIWVLQEAITYLNQFTMSTK